jgi:hypothetical protein
MNMYSAHRRKIRNPDHSACPSYPNFSVHLPALKPTAIAQEREKGGPAREATLTVKSG